MKNLVPISFFTSLTGLFISLLILSFSEIGFSFAFKVTLILSSLTLCLLAIWKSEKKMLIGVFSIVCFTSSIIILANTNLFLIFWKLVLILHFLLTTTVIFLLTKENGLISRLTKIGFISTTILLITLIITNIQFDWIDTVLFLLISCSTVLFIINNIIKLKK